MVRGEPAKGKYYIVRTFDAKGRPDGATICKFENRQGRGCQLHGDRMGYYYHFKKLDGGVNTVYVDFPEGEKDINIVFKQLGEYITPYDGTIDPWDFTQMPEKKIAA